MNETCYFTPGQDLCVEAELNVIYMTGSLLFADSNGKNPCMFEVCFYVSKPRKIPCNVGNITGMPSYGIYWILQVTA